MHDSFSTAFITVGIASMLNDAKRVEQIAALLFPSQRRASRSSGNISNITTSKTLLESYLKRNSFILCTTQFSCRIPACFVRVMAKSALASYHLAEGVIIGLNNTGRLFADGCYLGFWDKKQIPKECRRA